MNKIMKSAFVMGAIMIGIMPYSWAKFTDLKSENAYSNAIESLVEKGIIQGYPDNTFRPSEKMTRAEFAKIIVTLDGMEEEKEENIFTDIDKHWANKYIKIASSKGMIKGYGNKTFQPNKKITYAEVAAILLRDLGIEEKLDNNLKWPKNYMELASEIGLFDNIMTNDLNGNNAARRDNVVLMLWNQMNYEAKKEEDETTKEENNAESDSKINTRENHLAVVTKLVLRRGENYVTVKDLNGKEEEIKLYSKSTVPELQSFIVYNLTSNGSLKLKKQLLAKDIDDASMIVMEVDEGMAQIQGEEKWLDWELDHYTFSEKKIKLNRYTYYLVEMTEKDDGKFEFDTFEEIEKEKINLKKEDRICFDEDTKIALVIRGLE